MVSIPSEWLVHEQSIDIFGQPVSKPSPIMIARASYHINVLSYELGHTRDRQQQLAILMSIRETEAMLFWLHGITESFTP